VIHHKVDHGRPGRPGEGEMSMGGRRDWLVLSTKWSQGAEWLRWYRTNDNGYTSDVMYAGRYTKEEAIARQHEGETLAVPLLAALKIARSPTMIPGEFGIVEQLREAAREQISAPADF
jgi:hypothetical protein